MTVTGSAKHLEQGIAIARDGHRSLAQMYLRRAAEESPGDPNFWLWMAWLAESPAEMVYCLESLLAEQADHPLAQDGLRWARGLADAIAAEAPVPELRRPQDETDFEWTRIVDASSASEECEAHAFEMLGVAIAAVEELLILDIAHSPYSEEDFDELPSEPTAALVPVDQPLADLTLTTDAPLPDEPPAEASLAEAFPPEATLPELFLPEAAPPEPALPEPTLAPPEEPLVQASLADESYADADLSLADDSPVNEFPASNALTNESSSDSPLAELLPGDSLPASPGVNVVAEPLELPLKLLEYHPSAVAEDEDGDRAFDAGPDVQTDVAQEPVVQLSIAEQAEPELALARSQTAATVDQLLEPAAGELPPQPVPQELPTQDVPQDAPVVDFVVEGSSPAILVVDDSPTVRKLVTMTLSKHGYRVFSAADGVAAIEAIHACEPALIILDIDTPRLDGYKFFNLVKKGESTKGIKVVMLSGKDGIFDKFRRRMNGCTDTLTKPFSPETLLSMVEKFAVSPSQHAVPGQIDGPLPLVPLSTSDEAVSSVEAFASSTHEPVPGGLDDHCILHLSRLEHQVSLMHKPSTAKDCQQTLQTARIILADTLEFLNATERHELLDRNRENMCRVYEEIKKVDQHLEWPSLWGLLRLRTSAEQTQQQAFDELGVGYATLLESLLTQIGATFPDESHAAEWEASVRPLLVDIKQRW